jgi:hypothetical protein
MPDAFCGTDGSKPLPSSEASSANLTSSIMFHGSRDEGDRDAGSPQFFRIDFGFSLPTVLPAPPQG